MDEVTPRFKQPVKKLSKVSREAAWRKAVRERAGNRCQFPGCGQYSEYLDTHHVASRKQRPDLKYEVSNGRALCPIPCHQFVTEHPIEATEMGLVSRERYENRSITPSVPLRHRQQLRISVYKQKSPMQSEQEGSRNMTPPQTKPHRPFHASLPDEMERELWETHRPTSIKQRLEEARQVLEQSTRGNA